MRVDGVWPDPITLSAGWFRARARPWNEEVSEPIVRLDRGGPEFLISVVDRLTDFGFTTVYSPALFPSSTRVWRRAGFTEYAGLDIMERALTPGSSAPDSEVSVVAEPDWEQVLDIDRAAFEGFWGMSKHGLQDAYVTNKNSVLLTIGQPVARAYVLLGAQWGVAYLHRIAVRPEDEGTGLGRAVLTAALDWGYRVGARTMVLNVRPENARAKRFYERSGFVDTPTQLHVLRISVG